MKNLSRAGLSAALLIATTGSNKALDFNFIFDPGMDPNAVAGFIAAGERWSDLFTDNITLNINIGYEALGPGILAQASSSLWYTDFTTYRNFATADATSALDAVAVTSLPGSTTINALLNRTTDNGNSPTPYLDSDGSFNNQNMYTTQANMRALGLLPAVDASIDANITFSSSFSFDFDPSNGITTGSFDFVGIATHELGHALGFVSGVDTRDYYNAVYEGEYVLTDDDVMNSWMDVFRFSSDTPAGVQRDWTTDGRDKYFSVDGGGTALATFARGVYYGDGTQASHWEDSLGLGIMDPTAAPGELLGITWNDVYLFDALGYDFVNAQPPGEPVPEAGTMLGGAALAALGLWRARRRS